MAASRNDPPDAQVAIVEWEDLQQELGRLWSLSCALKNAKDRKEALALKLEAIIKERNAHMAQSNELEDKKRNLEKQKLVMGEILMRSKKSSDLAKHHRDQLFVCTRRLLIASKSLSGAFTQMQEANRILFGQRGHGHLCNLQRMLRARQQYMVAQVSLIYPVKESTTASCEGTLNSDSKMSGHQAGLPLSDESTSSQRSSTLTICGLELAAPFLKKASFFKDKKELQRSATALGYVAHVVMLIATFLDVPLRYPLKFGGSRSYICDNAPSIEPATSASLAPNSVAKSAPKSVEFPLFLEGQDNTRAAYAVFLLNKDIEQILNSVGKESLGPRHVLQNLKLLTRTIRAENYIDL
ncbi:UV radiation resistance-associated protein [Wolffia australiana]